MCSNFFKRTADLIGLNEVIPLGLKNLIHTTGPGLCETPVYEPLCRVVLSLVCGEDDEQMDKVNPQENLLNGVFCSFLSSCTIGVAGNLGDDTQCSTCQLLS